MACVIACTLIVLLFPTISLQQIRGNECNEDWHCQTGFICTELNRCKDPRNPDNSGSGTEEPVLRNSGQKCLIDAECSKGFRCQDTDCVPVVRRTTSKPDFIPDSCDLTDLSVRGICACMNQLGVSPSPFCNGMKTNGSITGNSGDSACNPNQCGPGAKCLVLPSIFQRSHKCRCRDGFIPDPDPETLCSAVCDMDLDCPDGRYYCDKEKGKCIQEVDLVEPEIRRDSDPCSGSNNRCESGEKCVALPPGFRKPYTCRCLTGFVRDPDNGNEPGCKKPT